MHAYAVHTKLPQYIPSMWISVSTAVYRLLYFALTKFGTTIHAHKYMLYTIRMPIIIYYSQISHNIIRECISTRLLAQINSRDYFFLLFTMVEWQ